jgi:hypothetical protein
MNTNLLDKKGVWQFWGAIVLGLSVLLSTYYVTKTIVKQKKLERVVTVKGLAEQVVKSDRANWDINFTSSNDNLAQAYKGISHAQEVTKNFLIKQGFKPEDIEIIPISIIDNQSNNLPGGKRYAVNSGMSVKTGAVDLVTSSVQKIGALVQEGVVVNNSNVRFIFTQLNTIKTAMLITATESARFAAKAFVENSHTKLGEISSASQGLFTIESANGNAYDDSSIMKKVRVVTSVTYYLN